VAERSEHADEEIERLRRCLNDLMSALALPAIWAGGGTMEILRTLLDALLGMLDLDFVYARLAAGAGQARVDMLRSACASVSAPEQVRDALETSLGRDPRKWPPQAAVRLNGEALTIIPILLGHGGELGVLVAGSAREGFPRATERLVVMVAANEGAIGLREALLLGEQKRLAQTLDQRVARRTAELAEANEELRSEIAARRLVEARKSAIVDSALDCVVAVDHDGVITDFNLAAERTFGYERDKIVGRKLVETLIPPCLREQHLRGFERHISSGEARVLGKRVEMTAMRADGSEFPLELSISRVAINGPPAFTAYLRDITDVRKRIAERERAEAALKQSEAFLAEGQRLSRTGSFSWCMASGEIIWSEQLYRIFELDRAVPVTMDAIVSRVHPDDAAMFDQVMRHAREYGEDFAFEHRLRMGDESVKHVHVSAHAVRDAKGRREYIGAVQDVTEARLSEQALARARAELTRVTRITTLGALTASIAHEVNQPLSGIITNASTCARMLDGSPPNVAGARETARRMLRDGNRAAQVIARLRALFAKKDSAALDDVDLNEAAREVIALSLTELQGNHVIVSTEFADELAHVLGDRIQLQQVILNLVRNASEAMTGVHDRAREIAIRTAPDGDDRVCLSVRDTGTGLSREVMERLFDAFYTTKQSGMGIGLAISRSIIESHQGRLWATNNAPFGATFHLSIPRRADSVTAAVSLGAIPHLASAPVAPGG